MPPYKEGCILRPLDTKQELGVLDEIAKALAKLVRDGTEENFY